MKLDIGESFEELLNIFKSNLNRTILTSTLHEDLHASLHMFQGNVIEKKILLMFSTVFKAIKQMRCHVHRSEFLYSATPWSDHFQTWILVICMPQ